MSYVALNQPEIVDGKFHLMELLIVVECETSIYIIVYQWTHAVIIVSLQEMVAIYYFIF